jgi:hypothetical protein
MFLVPIDCRVIIVCTLAEVDANISAEVWIDPAAASKLGTQCIQETILINPDSLSVACILRVILLNFFTLVDVFMERLAKSR